MQRESKWVRCPKCEAKTKIKVNEDTALVNSPSIAQNASRKLELML